MNLNTDIKPISYLKSKTADVIHQVNDNHRPLIITQNGEAKAVIQDIQSYENMKNTIGILKLIAMGEEDIKNGDYTPQDELFNDLEKSLF